MESHFYNSTGLDGVDQNLVKNTLLVEVAWEVCNQVGGIYTVIRSKIPTVIENWGTHYCLIGPYFAEAAEPVFDETADYQSDAFGKVALEMQKMGFDVHYGTWLVTGRPRVLLFNPVTAQKQINELKYFLWKDHDIPTPENDELLDQVIAFCDQVTIFFKLLTKPTITQKDVMAHFHEWMSGISIPQIRKQNLPVRITFTTHATILGRYLAMNDVDFYEKLSDYDWLAEAKRFGIESQVRIERAAAHGAQIFSTVSEVTGNECKYLLGRDVDVLTPNGINLERFTALHELQNLHHAYKEKLHQFVMAHFFPYYTFNLDKTLYFFTSGRFEFRNKGFDMTLEALARLNYMMKRDNIDRTIVMFFVTKQPFHSMHPNALHSRAALEELRQTCSAIEKQAGERLFYSAAQSMEHKLPSLNDFVDDYWKLRYRRTLQSWKNKGKPLVVTHHLVNEEQDQIMDFIKKSGLTNNQEDKVKIVYHPDFISSTNPLFGIEYGQFVRGCHLGIFPSYYEPWGYTPLECIARGVPAVTSDLSGFGDYISNNIRDHEDQGVYVVRRAKTNYDRSAQELALVLRSFIQKNRRERIEQRNRADGVAWEFDWQKLYQYYGQAYKSSGDIFYKNNSKNIK